jgi:Arc/MetJ-type ribon-helix-helix transcriptional regulator
MVTETLSIKVSKAEKNLLRQCARRNRLSASALLRDALRNVLQSPQASQASLLAQHGHLLEKLDRGPGDLSTNKARLSGYGK